MSQIEVRTVPSYKWRMGLIALVGAGFLYFFLGYVPTILWVAMIIFAFVLLFDLIRGHSSDPVIILSDEGVFDKRLKVGTIFWSDIRRIRSYNLHGADYISLELHDMNRYESRRPLWFTLLSQVQRVFGISSIAISTNGLDIDHTTLWHKLHEGCGSTSANPQTIEAG
jgi:hypothetical protein